MILSKKTTGKAVPMPAGVGLGVALSVVSLLIQCAALSWFVLKGVIGGEIIGYGSMGALSLSAMLGAAVASAKIKRRQMLVCLLTGALFLLVLVLVTVICFGGRFSGVITTVIVCLLGSGIVGVFGLRGKDRYRHGHLKV